jgi:F-type H+-transporting ATPase subunit b
MLINWFTVVAQVVNFLILVWLMRRYLYRPIVAAIDARAKQVAGVLAEADKKMTNASDQLSAYQQQVKGFDADRLRVRPKRLICAATKANLPSNSVNWSSQKCSP